jgi:hypothetical protein
MKGYLVSPAYLFSCSHNVLTIPYLLFYLFFLLNRSLLFIFYSESSSFYCFFLLNRSFFIFYSESSSFIYFFLIVLFYLFFILSRPLLFF